MEWNEYDIFCHVIHHGSFSAAAQALGRPKSSVSAAVTRLESRLGTRLIERTTRRLRLTDAGESLYREMSPVFGHLREVVGDVMAQGQSVSGTLRIAAPYEFGAHHLGAAACIMLARYPALEIDIDVEYSPVNLFARKYDIAFTMVDEELPSTSGVARRMFSLERGLYASAAFLAAHPEPVTVGALESLPLLAASSDREWGFTTPGGEEVAVSIAEPRLRSSNAGIRLQAALAGLGVARITATYCEPAVQAGQLRRLLADHDCAPLRVYALLPARRLMPAKVRVFLDILGEMAKARSDPSY
jgi:DNA-binding transcriptional LysR family regulator